MHIYVYIKTSWRVRDVTSCAEWQCLSARHLSRQHPPPLLSPARAHNVLQRSSISKNIIWWCDIFIWWCDILIWWCGECIHTYPVLCGSDCAVTRCALQERARAPGVCATNGASDGTVALPTNSHHERPGPRVANTKRSRYICIHVV